MEAWIHTTREKDIPTIRMWWTSRGLKSPPAESLLLPLSLVLEDEDGIQVSLIGIRTELMRTAIVDSLCTNPDLDKVKAAVYIKSLMRELEKRLVQIGILQYWTLVSDPRKVRSYQKIFSYSLDPKEFRLMTKKL